MNFYFVDTEKPRPVYLYADLHYQLHDAGTYEKYLVGQCEEKEFTIDNVSRIVITKV